MLEFSELGDQAYRLGFAGDTFNVAWHMRAALNPDWRVDFVTALGDDPFSSQMLEFFQKNGIGTSHIRRIDQARSGLYIIRQLHGDRVFSYWRDHSAAKQLAISSSLLSDAFAQARLIYFSGISLAILDDEGRKTLIQAVVNARAGGSLVAFDPNERPVLWGAQETMRHWLRLAASHSDIVLPTFADEKQYFGDRDIEACARRFVSLGIKEVAVKNGAEPAYAFTPDFVGEVAAVANIAATDPTGAGDCFNGIYLSSRLQGKSVQESLKAAHRVASVLVRRPGALLQQDLVREALRVEAM
jgi:2-dehydro-3-deoxygluconokinase